MVAAVEAAVVALAGALLWGRMDASGRLAITAVSAWYAMVGTMLLACAFGLRRATILWRIVLPGALPSILAGFRVTEVPIVFRDRSVGTSKMSARIAAEAMWAVPFLRRRDAAAMARRDAPADAIGTRDDG